MDQTYVYDQPPEEGLTLKKVGRFFKRGWLWMVLCVLAALVLTSIVVLPVKFFYKSEPVASISIEYVYKGADKGEDPNGGTLNVNDIISVDVLAAAVASADLEDVIPDISSLHDAMRVEPILSGTYKELVQAASEGDESAKVRLAELDYFPTRYDVIISNPKKLGLSDSQAKQLIDKIIDEYFNSFVAKFSQPQSFSADIYTLSQNQNLEYSRIYDDYVLSLEPIADMLDEIAKVEPTFSSSVKGAQLVSELANLETGYENFNDYILGNNVWRDKNTAYVNLKNTRKQLSDDIKSQQELALSYKAQIEKLLPNTVTVTGAGGVTTKTETYPQEYYDYQARLAAVNENVSVLSSSLTKTEIRINAVTDGADPGPLPEGDPPVVGDLTPTPSEYITAANEELAKLETQSAAFVNSVNETVSDYYGSAYLAQSVRKVLPAIVVTKTIDFELWVVYVVAALAGFVIGCIVAGVVISKSDKKQAKAALQGNTDSAEGEAAPQNADTTATAAAKSDDKK